MVLEKLVVPELVKFPGFYVTPRLITMFPRARLLSLFLAKSIQSRPHLHPISWRFILILSSISHIDLPLLTGFVTDYGAMAVMLWTTFPAVPISSQWCTSVWTSWEIPAWQAICNRRRREASWHLQDRDTWHQFFLHRDTSLDVTVGQMFKCQ